MADPLDRRNRMRNSWLDITIALAAVCISLASLWIAVKADRIQERILTASVWPVLLYESSNYVESESGSERPGVIRFTITNAGVGPALIQWFDVYYGGRPMASGAAFIETCCGLSRARAASTRITTNYVQDRVLAAREVLHFVEVPRSSTSTRAYRALDRERQKVYVRACYCSALEDCWLFDSRKRDRVALSACPKPDIPLFQG